ncbi:MAG TPA: hypothetical protein VIG99_24445 [Myxococcaceae bacterium]
MDGKQLGEMPLPEIELEVGSHTAILECDRRDPQCGKVNEPTRVQPFEVAPGKTTTVKHFFQ